MSALIKLHQLNGYIQTIYLAEYEDKLLLLDGCSRADVDLILSYITETLKRPLSHLKLIVVTHMHPDHAGAAIPLRRETGCLIAMSNTKGDWYHGIDGFLMHLTDIMLTKWVAKRKGKTIKNIWYKRKFKPDVFLNDEDDLPGFPDWSALKTPGHTDRDLSLYHKPSHKVYVADLMVIVKGRFIPPFPVFYPTWYRESIDRIFDLHPKGIYLAHHDEVTLTEEDLRFLKEKIPANPVTHWQSIKDKFIKSYLGRFHIFK